MNIVILHAHDAGRYSEPYGFPIPTPNLMEFAKEGVLFRKAYCTAPTCSPSRASMLTGQYPHEVGMYGLTGAQGWLIDDYKKHLAHTLNEAGFETVLAGCQHEADHRDLSPLPYQRMLDTRPQKGEFYQETIDHVERFLAEDHDRPFFLWVGLDEPHNNNLGRPELRIGTEGARFSKTRYYDPDKLDWRYTAPAPFLPDLPEARHYMRSFAEGARIMDEYIGRVLYALHHYGLEEDTLVIITTDHGIEMPGGKKSLTDQGIGVMLMMRGPCGFSGGRVIEPIVSHVDIYPTICEVLGIERKPWFSGTSLVPLVNGSANSVREEIFAEQTYHGSLEAFRCIRTERYKFVMRHSDTGPQMRHCGPLTETMEKAGFYDRPIGHEELFDLYLDPWEHCNRAGQSGYEEIQTDLKARLVAWMQESKDPFLSGDFPKPANQQ